MANKDDPEFRDLVEYLNAKSWDFGFEFEDHGSAVVIGVGNAENRLGLVTHAGVRPAQRSRWSTDPFSMDTTTSPGLEWRGAPQFDIFAVSATSRLASMDARDD